MNLVIPEVSEGETYVGILIKDGALSHDAPYPGMSNAFESHFAQSFTDREWRHEAQVWAAAWKAAKRHSAGDEREGE